MVFFCVYGRYMKMKRYNFLLNVEELEYLRMWLQSNGTTLSGYIRGLIHENCMMLKSAGIGDNPKDMTLTQFANMFTNMMKLYADSGKDEK